MKKDKAEYTITKKRTEITDTKNSLTSNVCYTDKSELKEFLVNETFSQICSTNKDEWRGIIFNK